MRGAKFLPQKYLSNFSSPGVTVNVWCILISKTQLCLEERESTTLQSLEMAAKLLNRRPVDMSLPPRAACTPATEASGGAAAAVGGRGVTTASTSFNDGPRCASSTAPAARGAPQQHGQKRSRERPMDSVGSAVRSTCPAGRSAGSVGSAARAAAEALQAAGAPAPATRSALAPPSRVRNESTIATARHSSTPATTTNNTNTSAVATDRKNSDQSSLLSTSPLSSSSIDRHRRLARAAAFNNRAVLLIAAGRGLEACGLLRACLLMLPGEPRPAFNLVLALWRLGRPRAACVQWMTFRGWVCDGGGGIPGGGDVEAFTRLLESARRRKVRVGFWGGGGGGGGGLCHSKKVVLIFLFVS